MSKRALIVVDVQKDFCEGGSLAVTGGAAVASAISSYVGDGLAYDFVLATRDHHIDPGSHFSDSPDYIDTWPPHCVVGTPGVDFHPNLVNRPFDAVFNKGAYSAAYSGFEGVSHRAGADISLGDWLAGMRVTAVDVCGLASDYCVEATALDAAKQGLDTTVLLDLTAPVDPANLPGVMARLAAHDVHTSQN